MLEAAADAVADAGIAPRELRAIGITNQRETTVLWERASSRPVGRAIVWQDRRTAARCAELPRELIRARTGLVPDPYFSASKLEWLLARTPCAATALAFGTVDSWLVWKLTDGRVHATDHTNASRTMLLDLERLEWDDELLALFSVERRLLPELHPSSGVIAEGRMLGQTLPIAGIAGDQQAALFGQCCFHPGQAKATYGTGSFVLAHVGTLAAARPRACSRPPWRWRPARRRSTRSRARSSRADRRSSGCGRARAVRRRGRLRDARAPGRLDRRRLLRACARRGSGRRTGIPTRAD